MHREALQNASGDLLTNAPVSAEWFLQFEGDDLGRHVD